MTEREEKKAARDRKEAERAQQRAAIRKAIIAGMRLSTDMVPVIGETANICTKEGAKYTIKESKHCCYELIREGYDNHPVYLTASEILNFLYINRCSYESDGRFTPFIINRTKATEYLCQSPSHTVWQATTGSTWRYLVGGFNKEGKLPVDEYITVPVNLSRKYIARDMIKAIIHKYRISNSGLARRLGIDHATLLNLYYKDRKLSNRLLQRIADEFPAFAQDCQQLMKRQLMRKEEFKPGIQMQ